MSLKINDNIDLPNSITAHNRISLNSVSVGGGGASPELIARVAKLERTVTKQQGAIEEMDRDLEGVHGTLESVGTDISELDTAMTAAEGEIDAIHSKNAAQDAAIATKQDQLTFDATPTEDSVNPVTSDGVFKSLADVIEIAEGKTSSFTLSAQTVGNEAFNSQAGSIEVASFTDINGNEVAASELKIGDIILVTELDVPDRWVGAVGEAVTLYRMETAKVDLSGYYTKSETDTLLSDKVDSETLDEYYTKLLSDARYFRVIDPPTSTTLTDEQVEILAKGVVIKGKFLGYQNPILGPLGAAVGGGRKMGFLLGQVGQGFSVAMWYISQENVAGVYTTILYYFQPHGYVEMNVDMHIGSLQQLNHKGFPAYPSTQTNKKYHFALDNGTLTWQDMSSDYYTKSETDAAIQAAIGDAIGGTY